MYELSGSVRDAYGELLRHQELLVGLGARFGERGSKCACVGALTAMGRGGVSAAVRPGLGLRLSGVRLHVDQIRKNQAGKCPAYARSAKRSCSAMALSARGSLCEIARALRYSLRPPITPAPRRRCRLRYRPPSS